MGRLSICNSGFSSHRQQRFWLDPRAEPFRRVSPSPALEVGFILSLCSLALVLAPLLLSLVETVCIIRSSFRGFDQRNWAIGYPFIDGVIHKFLYTWKMVVGPRVASSQRRKGNILRAVFHKRGPSGKFIVAMLIVSMSWVNLLVWSSRVNGVARGSVLVVLQWVL